MLNAQPAYGWIKKGNDKVLKVNTSRQKINLNGVYNIEFHSVIIQEIGMLNAQSTRKSAAKRKVTETAINKPANLSTVFEHN